MEDLDVRVLLLTRSLTDPFRGDRAACLARRLDELGIEPVIVCVEGEAPPRGETPVLVCPGLDDRWKRPWIIRMLRVSAEAGPADVIHALEFEMADAALALAELERTPYLFTVDDYPDPEARIRLSRRHCKGIIATRPELADELHAEFGVPRRMISVIPEGIERTVPREGPRRGGRVPVIGSAVSVQSGGGLSSFLNAARILTDKGLDAEYLVAWDRDEDYEWRRRVEKLGLSDRVTLSAVPPWEAAFWSALDVYCHTSAVPTVCRNLLAALAHGVPAVITDIETHRQYAPGGRPEVLVEPNNPETLAAAVSRILSEEPLAVDLAERGREIVTALHDPNREAAALASIYTNCLASEYARAAGR